MNAQLRRAALAAAALGLLGIGVRPTRPVLVPVADAILATPGVSPRGAAVLAESLGGAPLYADPLALRRAAAASPIRHLHVAGWGLDADAWRDLDSLPVVLHPAPPAPGIVRVSWLPQLSLGDRLTVEGTALGAPARSWIHLADPAGAVDSALLGDGGRFRLRAVPRAAGHFTYVLSVGTAQHPVAAETVGVTVVPPPAWRLLFLESAPSFETRALRDWIAAQHGSAALRSAVSRGRFRTEFVNRPATALAPVTGALLAQFDVVVVDGRALAALTGAERGALRRAVSEAGLGILIVPDTAVYDGASGIVPADRAFFLDFALARVPGLDARFVRPRWTGLARPITEPVPADPFTLRPRFGVESLVEDGVGGVLAQIAPRGAGRVGLSLVAGAAHWVRGGDRAAFAAYWSRLLAAVTGGRAGDGAPRWTIATPGPWLVNRPVTMVVQSARPLSFALVATPSGARDTVFVARDPLDTTRGVATYWPREPGWHDIEGGAGTALFAQRPTAWRGIQATDRLDATARYAVATAGQHGAPAGGSVPGRRPISALWFFGLFLAGAGTLWSARRPAGRNLAASPR